MRTIEGCLNNFTEEEIEECFCESESIIKVCNRCPYMNYEDGIMTCEKLTEIQEEG